MSPTTKPRGHVNAAGAFHGGQFTWKTQNEPELGALLVATDYVDEYDVSDFRARVEAGKLEAAADLNEDEQLAVSAATQAVNDVWVLENIDDIRQIGLDDTEANGPWVRTSAYRDGDRTLIDVRHTDETSKPAGSLFVLNPDGTVAAYDDHSDEFGERWTAVDGYRDQLFQELLGVHREGGVGSFL